MELPNSTFTAIGTSSFSVTSEVKAAFEDHGFILVRGLLDFEEIGLLKDFVENDSTIMENSYGRSDGRGKESRLALWNVAGDDLAGVVSRSQKVAGTMQALLGGDEIYHYHSKLIRGDPRGISPGGTPGKIVFLIPPFPGENFAIPRGKLNKKLLEKVTFLYGISSFFTFWYIFWSNISNCNVIFEFW